jgi:hypothetical protein
MTDQPGPMPQRIGDADRDKAAEFLRDHLAEGRLDQEEFDDRLTRALTAKTQSDLDPLFTDLPGPRPGSTLVPADTFKAPPWQAGQVVPKPAARPVAKQSPGWAIATSVAWPAVIIACFILGWSNVWWLMFIPIVISSIYGKMHGEEDGKKS